MAVSGARRARQHRHDQPAVRNANPTRQPMAAMCLFAAPGAAANLILIPSCHVDHRLNHMPAPRPTQHLNGQPLPPCAPLPHLQRLRHCDAQDAGARDDQVVRHLRGRRADGWLEAGRLLNWVGSKSP